MKIKIKITGTLIFLVLCTLLFAQNKDYATIHIYRTGFLTALNDYPVIFNNMVIYELPYNNRLSYKIYSEGKLNIELPGNVKINLNVKNGQEYYIKCPNTGISKLVTNDVGKKDFDKEKDQPNLYTELEEDLNYPIIRDSKNLNKTYLAEENKQIEEKKTYLASDVDINIPFSKNKYDNKYALIIGNEDYSSYQTGLQTESNVDFAVNDAQTMKEYAKSALGIPDGNIIYLENAKTVEMSRAIKTLSIIMKNSNGKADILFYYAGHGFPDEATSEPYLIPVDVSGTDLRFAVKLSDLYAQLTEFPAQKITVILDACFSGGGRNQSLVAARGVKVKPKDNILTGNMVVFTASSGEQSSLPYKDKNHGLFTYFLLKKIQETEGNISYKELSDFLGEQVAIKSALINQKEQNPQTLISNSVKDSWFNWKIK